MTEQKNPVYMDEQKDPVYRYQDQDGEHTITRSEILTHYFLWWSDQMKKAGREDMISETACIEDFKVVHWAWRVVPEHDG